SGSMQPRRTRWPRSPRVICGPTVSFRPAWDRWTRETAKLSDAVADAEVREQLDGPVDLRLVGGVAQPATDARRVGQRQVRATVPLDQRADHLVQTRAAQEVLDRHFADEHDQCWLQQVQLSVQERPAQAELCWRRAAVAVAVGRWSRKA